MELLREEVNGSFASRRDSARTTKPIHHLLAPRSRDYRIGGRQQIPRMVKGLPVTSDKRRNGEARTVQATPAHLRLELLHR